MKKNIENYTNKEICKLLYEEVMYKEKEDVNIHEVKELISMAVYKLGNCQCGIHHEPKA